ncbi:hypothetical protein JTE90_003147 [Oedothorax gibbosus]|uniref:Uncharacterized protein n=1 Tax=Oedothorax gibbosus TaxID=931172 RepID=A0AAV6UB59_9ARAC|nr:hypothetical protein JTE90_003147 [Oedothorax gibbosus]
MKKRTLNSEVIDAFDNTPTPCFELENANDRQQSISSLTDLCLEPAYCKSSYRSGYWAYCANGGKEGASVWKFSHKFPLKPLSVQLPGGWWFGAMSKSSGCTSNNCVRLSVTREDLGIGHRTDSLVICTSGFGYHKPSRPLWRTRFGEVFTILVVFLVSFWIQ